MQNNQWARLLAYVTGFVNQRLLLQCEYLAAENRILRSHLPERLRLTDPQRSTLAEIGKRLGRMQLAEVACVAKPDAILAWYRRLIARKFDGSKHRSYPGRPRIDAVFEALIVRLARENSGWGYDRIVGALANLGHPVSDQTVGNTLKRYGIAPAPQRKQKTTCPAYGGRRDAWRPPLRQRRPTGAADTSPQQRARRRHRRLGQRRMPRRCREFADRARSQITG
jgi:hypothetical protein